MQTISELQANLNDQQLAICDVIKTSNVSAIVLARAGTGKTYLLVIGVVPTIVENNLGTIALMAYNKTASDEFKSRLGKLAKDTGNDTYTNFRTVNAGTVHSFGLNFWKYWNKQVQVKGSKVGDLIKSKQSETHPNIYNTHFTPIVQLVSLAKQHAFGHLSDISDDSKWYELVDHHDIDLGGRGAEVIEACKTIYEASLAIDHLIVDFDDMILAPLVHNSRVFQYDFVLIDEAQDTNPARRALALKMLKPTGRLIAVGDDKQAIYGFTGADANSLDLIRESTNAQILPLTITYRCPKVVVRRANQYVPDLIAHPSAPEGVERFVEHTQASPIWTTETFEKTDAILCRITVPLVELAHNLITQGIPCKVEGRDIGSNLIQLAKRWKRVTTIGQLIDTLNRYRDTETQKWASKDRPEKAQQIEDRCDTLISICNKLTSEKKNSIDDVVKYIESLFDDVSPGEVLTLSTIHKAKGKEWDRVFLWDYAHTIPSRWAKKDWQIDQEMNLAYVGITRVKKEIVDVYVEKPLKRKGL